MMMLLLQQQQSKINKISESHRQNVSSKVNNYLDHSPSPMAFSNQELLNMQAIQEMPNKIQL